MNFLSPYRQFESASIQPIVTANRQFAQVVQTTFIVTRFKQLVSYHSWFNILGLSLCERSRKVLFGISL